MRTTIRRMLIAALVLVTAPALAGSPAKGTAPSAPASATASAAPAPTASPSAVQAASELSAAPRQLYLDASIARDAHDNPKAYELLTAAWKEQTHWQIAKSLGEVEMALGKDVDAAGHLAYYQRQAPADQREQASKSLGEATAKVGTLVVNVEPADAEIHIDGAKSSVKSGEVVYVTADAHHKVLVKKGELLTDFDLVIEAGKRHVAKVVLEEMSGTKKEIVIAGAAVAGAGLIAGAVLLGVGFGKNGDAAKLQDETVAAHGKAACASAALPECKDQLDLLQQSDALRNAGVWTMIGGAVVGLGTAGYMLATRSKAPPPVQAGVLVTPNGGGASVRWSF